VIAAAALSVLVVVVAVLGLGTPAMAHGQFVSANPAPGSTVTYPIPSLLVYFTEKPASNAFFSVTAPSGARVDKVWFHGPPRELDVPVHEWYHNEDGEWETRAYDMAYPAQIPIAYWPEPGEYKVTFISVATDNEPVRGEFTFNFTGAVSTQPADFHPQNSSPDPNLLAAAATDAPTAPPSALPIEEQVAAEQAGPGLWVLWIPFGLALIVAAVMVAFWRLRPQQARALLVSRFGGRYAAPQPRRPLQLRSKLEERLPAGVRERLSGAKSDAAGKRREDSASD
jgi:methionine-rich copper-binding protein CopC